MRRKPKIFLRWISVMKIQCVQTAIVTTDHAFTTFVLTSHPLETFASHRNGFFQVLSAISIGSAFRHTYLSIPLQNLATASCTTIVLPRNIVLSKN